MKKVMTWVNRSPAAMRYVMITTVIAMVYFVLQKLHHRDGVADFRVYYDAARAFIGNDTLYGVHFGVDSGYYKYSPFALLPFIPFTFLPYPVAAGIYYFFVLTALILFSVILVYYLEKQIGFSAEKRGWTLLLMTVFLADHFERELHLGNVNVFLLILSFLVFRSMMKGRDTTAGFLYAFILLFKPHFIILFPYFLWQKKIRLLAMTLLFFIMGLALPAIVTGWEQNMALLREWGSAMMNHNIQLSQSPNTIYGIYQRYILSPFHIESGSIMVWLLLGVVAVLFLWLLIYNRRKFLKSPFFFIEYFILIALIPNLTHTDTEHFMWTWPLIALSILILLNKKIPQKWIYILWLILAFIPYCLNSPDIVGRKWMLIFDEKGLLGVANLMIISAALALFYKMENRHPAR